MTTSSSSSTQLNTATVIGMRFYVGIGPQYNFEYVDSEPCGPQSGAATTDIKGAVTGVPKLGSAMYLAFVGEEVDARWYGATDAPGDWGDGGGGGFTHTYSAPGGYWVTIRGSNGAASATRFCRVVYRNRPATGSGISYTAFDVPYPMSVEQSSKGQMTNGFGFQCRVSFSALDWSASDLGAIYERSLIGLFAQEYRYGQPYGNLQLVVGGWVSNRSFTEAPGIKELSFTAYGPCFWMLNAPMREQFYIDPGIIGAGLAAGADSTVNGGNPLTDDVFGQGYVPNHWIKCDCVTAALHVIQHMQVYATLGDNPGPDHAYSPVMSQVWGTNYYGNLGQFLQIGTDPDVDETAGKTVPGFASFNVSNGMMLSNVRQLIENEGFVYYDRADLTQRIERKPYYWSDARLAGITPTLVIDDVTKLVAGRQPFESSSGTQKNVRQVIVEKPILATPSDVTETSTDSSGLGLSLRDPAHMRSAFDF